MSDPLVDVTLYSVNGLLTWEQLHVLLNMIDNEMDVAEEQRDFDLMGNLLGIRSMLMSTEMEDKRTFGELLAMITEPGKLEQ